MIQRIPQRIRRMDEEEGFTLIELMVVVLIIGILIAIAVPTFLGARARAENRAAESNLRNALTAAKTYMTDGDTYTGFNVSAAKSVEPSINWVPTSVGSSPSNSVGVATTSDGDTVYLEAQSGTGNCYEIIDKVTGGNIGTYYRVSSGGTGACTVDTTPPASSSATNPAQAGW